MLDISFDRLLDSPLDRVLIIPLDRLSDKTLDRPLVILTTTTRVEATLKAK